jgi:nuclear transport factor 2 (NTF2) superfamily protein
VESLGRNLSDEELEKLRRVYDLMNSRDKEKLRSVYQRESLLREEIEILEQLVKIYEKFILKSDVGNEISYEFNVNGVMMDDSDISHL